MRSGTLARSRLPRIGFTILELMLAMGIFALILTAIYSIWIAILKGTRAGQKAAAEVQRARVTMRALEDAFNGSQFYLANYRYYYFYANTDGDFADVSLVARLPDRFLGSEQYQQLQQKIRRVHFEVVAGRNGTHDLMMTQTPILLPDKPENANYEPYAITLAKDVTHFQMAFFDPVKAEWLEKWEWTNRIPKVVQIALGLGKSANDSRKPSELVYSLIALPTEPVMAVLQGGAAGGMPGMPPAGPPGTVPPGGGVSTPRVPPGSGFPPGTGSNSDDLRMKPSVAASPRAPQSGIALIIVLIVIVVLGILAGGFAYTMRVETTLARNASFNTELDWIARAGVGYCQWLLSKPCPYDALTQRWAKGAGDKCEGTDPGTGEMMRDESILDEVPVGNGGFTWQIVDQDRHFNINRANEALLKEALTLIGVDAADVTTVVNSILDWRDLDKNPRMSGTETEVYEQQDPPYVAKDGPLDDLSELMLIRGITPGIYKGSGGGALQRIVNRAAGMQSEFEEPVYAIGMADLFCTLSGPTVNINTASAQVLQMVPGIDENIAMAIIQEREGVNGPFHNVAQVTQRIRGLPIDPNLLAQLAQFFGVKSIVFKAEITAKISGASRKYVAILVRAPGGGGRAANTIVLSYYSLNSETSE